jgi:uncharacterized glyoxalase superfamily protein PhnB
MAALPRSQILEASTAERAPAVVPVLRYRNLPAAIDWLCRAFGFERHRVTVDGDGTLLFAQLTFGSSLIMISPVRASAFDKLMRQPDEVGWVETQVCYFFVADARAHCAQARAAGAEIVFNVEDRANGGRCYSCRDPEGHLWNFGTYNPWAQRALRHAPAPARGLKRRLPGRSRLTAGLLALVSAIVVLAGDLTDHPSSSGGVAAVETGSLGVGEAVEGKPRALLRIGGDAGQEAGRLAEQQLATVRTEIDELRKLSGEVERRQLEIARERDAADQLVKDLRERLDKASREKTAAEQLAKEVRRQLARAHVVRRLSDARKRLQPPDASIPW